MLAELSEIQIPVLWGLVPLLLATALYDLRQMRIPNLLVAAFLCLYMASLLGAPDLAHVLPQVAAAAVVLVVGFTGFAFRLLGGGDVKVLAALVLFVPTPWLGVFALALSISLLVGIALVQTTRRLAGSPGSTWAFLRDTRRFPMGVSIAMAGLSLPVLNLALN